MSDSYAQVQAETRTLWRDWLTRKHATSPGIWLFTWKKTSRGPAPGERVPAQSPVAGAPTAPP